MKLFIKFKRYIIVSNKYIGTTTNEKERKGRYMEGVRIEQEIQKQVEEIILQEYQTLYRVAFSYVKHEQDALDIVQNSVYKAIKSCKQLNNQEYIKAWLCKIVVNTALDYIRKRKGEVSYEELYETGVYDTYSDFDTQNALGVLDDTERMIVMMKYFEDQKISDIAKVLGININTVKTKLYRALDKLRVELTKE